MGKETPLGPGEANSRRRIRRKYFYLGLSAVLGAAIGGLLAATERGEGNFFSRDIANLSLDPAVAIAMCAVLVLAFLLMPLWGFSQIDEHLREQNLIGFTGGALAVIAGYPVWVMLYAGGFTEEPHAFGVYVLVFSGTAASFLYAKLRDYLPF